jgi:LysM repeat protein
VRYSTSSASLTPATTPVVDDLGTYNAVGLATQYTVEVNTDTTAAYNYTNTYKYDYVGFGGSYREARQQASITLPGYTSGTTTTTFDAHGNAIQIDNPNGEPKSQRFIVDAQGRILHKDVTQKDNSVVHQDYAYVNGNLIGSNGDAESVYYDYNYTPISDQYPASNPGQYIVQSSGETLQGIAQSVFGDANLWYLIADANGLSAGATLVAGQALTIPNQVSNLHNDANTFRPYQPNEIIGDTTAAVKAPPPPKLKSGLLANILAIVVAVAVTTVLTGGSGGLLAPVAGAIGDTPDWLDQGVHLIVGTAKSGALIRWRPTLMLVSTTRLSPGWSTNVGLEHLEFGLRLQSRSRYSLGVMPSQRRKARVKLLVSEKPSR